MNRDEPVPPPLPASHPTQKDRWRDSVRIPALFYVEVAFGQILFVVALLTLRKIIPWIGPAVVFGQPVLLFYLTYRLARRVIESHKLRGKPRWDASAVFALAMILPALGAFFLGKYMVEEMRERPISHEASTLLAGIRRAERQFKVDFGRFTLNARELGYRLPEDFRPHYVVGFATACSVKEGVSQDKAQWPVEDPTYVREKRAEIEAYFLNVRHATDCKDPNVGFEAFAVGVSRAGAPLDAWSIDERGALQHLQNGD